VRGFVRREDGERAVRDNRGEEGEMEKVKIFLNFRSFVSQIKFEFTSNL
jgi:hypothetical protein